MPDTVQFKNGNQIINHYAADERKLSTDYVTLLGSVIASVGKDTVRTWTSSDMRETGTVYNDNMEYSTARETSPSLFRIHNPEGYAKCQDIQYFPKNYYFYYRQDHLGNNREVWCAAYFYNNTLPIAASVVQRTNYYPSGLPWADATGASTQPYKYNGKEFIEMHGYDMYDYGARGYYPAIERFTTVDPLAENITPLALMRTVV